MGTPDLGSRDASPSARGAMQRRGRRHRADRTRSDGLDLDHPIPVASNSALLAHLTSPISSRRA